MSDTLLIRKKIKTSCSKYYGRSSELSSGQADVMFLGNLLSSDNFEETKKRELNLNLNKGVICLFEKRKWTLAHFLEMTSHHPAKHNCRINVPSMKCIGTTTNLMTERDTSNNMVKDLNVTLDDGNWIDNFETKAKVEVWQELQVQVRLNLISLNQD